MTPADFDSLGYRIYFIYVKNYFTIFVHSAFNCIFGTCASHDFTSVNSVVFLIFDIRDVMITVVANIILNLCRFACACLNELLWNNTM